MLSICLNFHQKSGSVCLKTLCLKKACNATGPQYPVRTLSLGKALYRQFNGGKFKSCAKAAFSQCLVFTADDLSAAPDVSFWKSFSQIVWNILVPPNNKYPKYCNTHLHRDKCWDNLKTELYSTQLVVLVVEILEKSHNWNYAAFVFGNSKPTAMLQQQIVAVETRLIPSYLELVHLFVKIPRPGDSEVIFWSSSQAATCHYQSNHPK